LKYAEKAKEVFNIEIAAMQKVRDGLGEEFDRAVELILRCQGAGGKIVVTGIGKNLPIGKKIAATLSSTGSAAVVLHPIEAQHGDIGVVCEQDVVIAMSYSGETEELLGLLPSLKRLKVKIIALTGVRDSTLGRYSDEIIPVTVEREACPFNIAPTSSTTTALAVGDALAMVLLEARGFRKEDFARLHPGGSIGRTLLLKAADIMRRGERVARVAEEASVQQAVLAMTRARAGSVAVVDEDSRLLGIFTDGDLRRHVTAGDSMEETPVSRYMSRDPITVTADHLAVEVLSIYENHNIDDLVVLDAEKRVVGVIDIQDLPKVKLL
jgi:arabinose-5-phosphate isomerase